MFVFVFFGVGDNFLVLQGKNLKLEEEVEGKNFPSSKLKRFEKVLKNK